MSNSMTNSAANSVSNSVSNAAKVPVVKSDQWKPFFAGSFAGVLTKTTTAPLERMKTLLQVEGMVETTGKATANDRLPAVFRIFLQILQRDGVLGFWHGNGANCFRVVPVYALKFGFNDAFKNMVRTSPGQQLSFAQLVTSGTLAGLFQVCTTYPLDTVRTRLTTGAAHGVQYNGILHCFSSTLRHEGVRGLYKGLAPTILSGSPYVGLQFTFFTMLTRESEKRQLFNEKTWGQSSSMIQSAACGALAGTIAQVITYPGDTVRRRLQTDGMNRNVPELYRGSMVRCARSIWYQEGPQTLYAGLGVNVARGIPGAAVQFTAFNAIKKALGM